MLSWSVGSRECKLEESLAPVGGTGSKSLGIKCACNWQKLGLFILMYRVWGILPKLNLKMV